MSTDTPNWRGASPRDYEPYFSKWMMELTAQGLHDKGDIALVLAMQERELAAVKAECDALRRNSERYIWLRDNHEINPKAGTICYEVCGRHWDAAIDAAMREAG